MTVMLVCSRDPDDSILAWEAHAAPRRGHVIAVRPDDWAFGRAELSSPDIIVVKADIEIGKLERLMASDSGHGSAAVQHPWRRERLDLEKIMASPGVRFASSGFGLVIEIPSGKDEIIMSAIVAEPVATNPQVIQ